MEYKTFLYPIFVEYKTFLYPIFVEYKTFLYPIFVEYKTFLYPIFVEYKTFLYPIFVEYKTFIWLSSTRSSRIISIVYSTKFWLATLQKASSNFCIAITFTFRLILLRKAWTPLSLYAGLQHYSKWVRTPITLLHLLSDQYPWERHEHPYLSMLDCNNIVSEFELQSHNYIYFQTNTFEKGMNPPILLCWTATL